MKKILNAVFLMLVGIQISMAGAPAQPENLELGLKYLMVNRQAFTGATSIFEMEITGMENVGGYEALVVSDLTPDGEIKATAACLRTEGSKVYEWQDGEWFLIYDFGLQPGEVMEGFYLPQKDRVSYRCVSIQENPRYNGLKTITLEVKGPNDEDFIGNDEWIIGIGSVGGILSPVWDDIQSSGMTFVECVSIDGEEFFNLNTLSVCNPAIDRNSLMTETVIYDLQGQRIHNSTSGLLPGIYIKQSENGLEKIRIHH
ncbi:MAG: hypothetical protein HDR80_01120 [Bacteroides sp.]|nr:hypothetical protein [Bacteroides sp.]